MKTTLNGVMPNKKLCLGFHYHVPVVYDNHHYKLPGHIGIFIDSLASEVDRIIFFAHHALKRHLPFIDYEIQHENVQVINIGPLASHPYRIMHASIAKHAVELYTDQLDALLIRGPSELLPDLAKVAQNKAVPTILLLVGDYLSGINDLPQPFWRKEIIRIWAKWNAKRQLEVAQRSLVFVNSKALLEKNQNYIPDLRLIQTTTLSANDFVKRSDTCQDKPIRLLYTGRMDRAKGLLEVVEAIAYLVQQGEDVVVDLVGPLVENDPILTELNMLSQQYGITDRVVYRGYKKIGPELFEFYKRADIYVIPSYAEGFPRAIWEAMAHGLPVIATKVGSIPHYLKDGKTALLIEPRSSSELADAINRLIRDKDLRQQLITCGIAAARPNTLEHRSKELVEQIESYIVNAK